MDWITIEGAGGEGGGQILRTALALSMVTGKPFRMEQIRARRSKPGLLRQHLTAVQAAAEVSQATVTGATLGSSHLTFVPGQVQPGAYTFTIGTAGSTTLVLQTVLPALLCAAAPSTLTLEGGTHNPFAPPFDFLVQTFLPLVQRMGPQAQATLVRPGFYPAGGGQCSVSITPATRLQPLELCTRGAIRAIRACAVLANLPRSIAEREVAVIGQKLSWHGEWLQVAILTNSRGPGNIVTIAVESEHVTEVFTGFGERGVSAEAVATQAAQAARHYLAAEVVVGEYLADQLLLPFALAQGGAFTTLPLSRHATTNIQIIRQFLPVHIHTTPLTPHAWQVTVVA
ncbi:MAG: RNA 3'-terminal phosphate cyclase [Candidatus Tectomicrobia bacterium]|uniref:RNA 3'-terminal phosphate cyclase n=1 Tax=Tectimicrobiota bacterium TaxID=2528274 RepID=A0A938B3F8_UNCTE|nr:RNA 3'-terminal phosphate cyclase [Candidatus Tectomicrobia bacterium]